MTTFIDIQLIEGLGLEYVAGAEIGLLDLDPIFDNAWQAFVAAFPGQTLTPRFDNIPFEQLRDLVDGIRVSGGEPPNPFLWFKLSCDDSVVDTVLAAVQGLPFVNFAERRLPCVPAGTVSWGTNPDAVLTFQIQPAPFGVDAIYAWQVAGGAGDGARIADIEGGWRLDHEELVTARIREISVFGSSAVDHGTAVAGIVVGADNGVGTIGIVPNAEFDLITEDRGLGTGLDLAQSILLATVELEAGDVLLIELLSDDGSGLAFPVESNRAVQLVIQLANGRGITVIEPAGDSGLNLDTIPVFAHMQPGSPTFVDSGAIVVGAADLNVTTNNWHRTVSSFGSRISCFAAGSAIRAPSSSGTNTYQLFAGTSGAAAIVAGVAGSIQSMWRAAKSGLRNVNPVMPPADLRRLLSIGTLGTLPDNPPFAKIGPMPDLRKLTNALRLARVVPVGAALIQGDAVFIVHLDANNRMVRREFTPEGGWGPRIPTPTLTGSPSPSDSYELLAAQPAVMSSDEDDPINRRVFDALFSGDFGIQHMFWDSRNQSGDVRQPLVSNLHVAWGSAPAAVRAFINLLVIAVINLEGRLVVSTGDPQGLPSGMSEPHVLDTVGTYRRMAGPTMIRRSVGTVEIVVIEDGGSLNWFTGNFISTIGATFSGVTDLSGVAFDPGARPALYGLGNLLIAAAVGTDGLLRAVTIDPVTRTIAAPVVVDDSVSIGTSGPVALARAGVNIVVLAVDKQGLLRAATRLTGGNWTALEEVPYSGKKMSPLGGVTAVSIDQGMMAITVNVDGVVCSATSEDGLTWKPLVPLP